MPRARTWGLMVPIHLVAFVVLYFATVRILEFGVRDATTEGARERLNAAAGEIYLAARAYRPGPRERHNFGSVLQAQRGIELRLFLPGGGLLGPETGLTGDEHNEVVEILRGGRGADYWVAEKEGRILMRGLRRIVASAECTPCHQPGQTLAVASMTQDLTTRMARLRGDVRRNLALLLIAWAALVGATNALVKQSARRSAERLQREIAAAEEGRPDRSPTRELVLDPVSAEVLRSVRGFLARRRERDAQMASRLERTDQLASLGRMAAGLAHEIRNPLAGIQGALEILQEDLADDASKQLCGEMLAELSRVNDTLQLLLQTARPSAAQPVATDLGEFLEGIGLLLEPGLKRRSVRLVVETGDTVTRASFDPAKIRQVLVNLVNNAADAIEGDGTITVRAGSFPEEGGVIFTVEDDGPGIAPELLPRIFEPFYTTKFSGTGLGLAIAQSLVEQHGGSLEAESEVGVGTRFYVLLPQAGEERPAPESSTSADTEE